VLGDQQRSQGGHRRAGPCKGLLKTVCCVIHSRVHVQRVASK
jgi:hypothetical protein